MSTIRNHTIELQNLIAGSVTCSNFEVVSWESPYCNDIQCELQGGKVIKVQVNEDCADTCFYVTVKCLDPNECNTCDQQQKLKVCPCLNNTHCAGCEICSNNGVCVSVCEEGQVCNNNQCSDCNDTTPCTGGKKCVKGKCQCPADKPYTNYKGECVDCSVDSDCPKGFYCTPDGCKPIDCGDGGVVDPNTGNCVECTVSGHCGDNEVCNPQTKKCECAEGFVRNASGECVPQGCTSDGQCPNCQICDANGNCVPRRCPDGYVCVPHLNSCRKICDCDNPTCNSLEACTRLNSTTCYCSMCEGDCSRDGDCGVDCYCASDKRCRPNPCKGNCQNGGDCGPECGCNKVTGKCEPCDGKACNAEECGNLLGCDCSSGLCLDDNSCQGFCSKPSDCGPNCTCYKGRCIPCADLGLPNGCGQTQDGCIETTLNDILVDEDNCNLTARFTGVTCCSCPVLEVKTTRTEGAEQEFDFKGFTVKGKKVGHEAIFYKDGTKLSESDIVGDDDFQAGKLKVIWTVVYSINNGLQQYQNVSAPVEELVSGQDTYNGFLSDQPLPYPGQVIEKADGSKIWISQVYSELSISEDIEMGNNCVYTAGRVGNRDNNIISGAGAVPNPVSSPLGEAGSVRIEGEIDSSSCRLPVISWYRSRNAHGENVDELFRKVYVSPVTGTSSTYEDVLSDYQDGLWDSYVYRWTADCACQASDEPTKADFCLDFNSMDVEVVGGSCGDSIVISNVPTPCDVLSLDTPNDGVENNFLGKSTPDDAKVKWVLNLIGESGTQVSTEYKLPLEVADLEGTHSLPGGEKIASVQIWKSTDKESCMRTWKIPKGGIMYDVKTDCDTLLGGKITVSFNTSGNYTITGDVSGSVTGGDEIVITGVPKGTINFTITDGTCTTNDSVDMPDCCTQNLQITDFNRNGDTVTMNVGGSTQGLVATVTNLKTNDSWLSTNFQPGGIVTGNAVNMTISPELKANTTYRIKFVNDFGCTGEIDFTVECKNVVEVTGTYNSSTESVTFTLPTTVPKPLTYNGNVLTPITPGGSNFSIGVSDITNGEKVLTLVDANGCQVRVKFTIDSSDLDYTTDVGLECRADTSPSGFNFGEGFRIGLVVNYRTKELPCMAKPVVSNVTVSFKNGTTQVIPYSESTPAASYYTDSINSWTTKLGKLYYLFMSKQLLSCDGGGTIDLNEVNSVNITYNLEYTNGESNSGCPKNGQTIDSGLTKIVTGAEMIGSCCNTGGEGLNIDVSWTETDCEYSFSVFNFGVTEGYNLLVRDSNGQTVYSAFNETVEEPTQGSWIPTANGTYTVEVTDNGTGTQNSHILSVDCLNTGITMDLTNSICDSGENHILQGYVQGGVQSGALSFLFEVYNADTFAPTALLYTQVVTFANYNPNTSNVLQISVPSAVTLNNPELYYVQMKPTTSSTVIDQANIIAPECLDCTSGITFSPLSCDGYSFSTLATITGGAAGCTRVFSGISYDITITGTAGTLVEGVDYNVVTGSAGYIVIAFLDLSHLCPALDGALEITINEYKVEEVSGCPCESVIDTTNPIVGTTTFNNAAITAAYAGCTSCP